MKGNRITLIIVVTAICVLLAFLLYQFGGKKQVNWFTMFREKEQQPYDLVVISSLLGDYFPGKSYNTIKKPLFQALPVSAEGKNTYVFIGEELFLSDTDNIHLCDFVSKGNDAFIAAEHIPYDLLLKIFSNEEYAGAAMDYLTDSTVHFNFTNQKLKTEKGFTYDFIFEWEKENYTWYFFSDSILLHHPNQFVSIGTLNDSVSNFISVPFGNGTFYLHTTPICFTNYFLKQQEGLQYAQQVCAHLSPSPIYWDEFSKVPKTTYHHDNGDTATPLRYILSQQSLRWAWYVLLGMVALFLLFRAKRDQRMIPVLEQNANTSMEFIHTIGRLYFLQQDHRALAVLQMKLLLAFIRNRYGLNMKTAEVTNLQQLAQKSQVNVKDIQFLFDEYQTIENMNDINTEHLFRFHGALETFYSRCK